MGSWQRPGTSTFGQKPGFGGQAAGGSAFQRPAAGGFGGGTTSTFGGAAAGQSRFGAGAAPTGFGANKPTTGFGATGGAAAGGFGAKPAGAGGFGAGAQTQQTQQQTGGGPPNWRPTPVTETVTQQGSTVHLKTELLAITAMDFYKDYSFEYLRYLNIMDPATHPAQQQQQQAGFGGGAAAGGGFGQRAAATGAAAGAGFGQRPAGTGFGAGAAAAGTGAAGGFGQRPAGTGFGAGAAATGTGAAGGFGQRPAGTSFGAGAGAGTATTGFGARPAATTGFGAKPAGTATTGFGARPAGGFGTGAATTQQPVFQTGGGGFGAAAGAPKFGGGATSFGNNALRTANANVPRDGAATTGFGARPAGGFGTGAAGGYGTGAAAGGFGAGTGATSSFQRPTMGYGASTQAQAQEPIYYTTIGSSPFGILPQILKDAAAPKQPAETPKPTTNTNAPVSSSKKKHMMLPHYKLTPRSETRSAPVTSGLDTEATGRDMFVSKMGGVKKLVIETNDAEQSALFNPTERARLRQGLSTASASSTVPSTPSGAPGHSSMYMTTPSGYTTPSYPAVRERNDTSAIYMAPLTPGAAPPPAIYTSPSTVSMVPPSSQAPKLTIPGCFTIPSIPELRQKSASELARLPEFTVGHSKFGTVTWKTPTDVRNLNLDTLVAFQQDSIEVYPEATYPHGSPADGVLNKPATVKIYNVSVDTLLGRSSGAAPSPGKHLSSNEAEIVTSELRRLTASFHGRFVSFTPEDFSWTFEVDHFTRYGLGGSNAVPTTSTTTSPAKSSLLRSSRSARSVGLRANPIRSAGAASSSALKTRSRGSSTAHSEDEMHSHEEDLVSAHGGTNAGDFDKMDADDLDDEDFDGRRTRSEHGDEDEDDSSGLSVHSSDEEDEEEDGSDYSQEEGDDHDEDYENDSEIPQGSYESDFSQSDSVSQHHHQPRHFGGRSTTLEGDERRKTQHHNNRLSVPQQHDDFDDRSVASRRSHASRASTRSRRKEHHQHQQRQEPYLLSDLLDEPESRSHRAPHLARQIGLHAPKLQDMKASLFSPSSPGDFHATSGPVDRFQTSRRTEIPTAFTASAAPASAVPSHYPTSPWDTHSSKRFKTTTGLLSEVKIRAPLSTALPRTPFEPLGHHHQQQRAAAKPHPQRMYITSDTLAGKAEPVTSVPLADSVTKDATTIFIDPMLHQGRSSRVCWGPNGTIIHTKFTTVMKSKVVVSPTSVSQALIPALSAHKKFAQLVTSTSNTNAALPTVSLREDWNAFVDSQIGLSSRQLAEVEKAILALGSSASSSSSSSLETLKEAKIKFQTEKQVWSLFKTLFGTPEYQPMLDEFDGLEAGEHLTRLVRKHQLDSFLMANTLDHVKSSLLALNEPGMTTTPVEKHWKVLFTLLTGKKIKEAVEMALSMGEHRLAILLAQAADPTSLHHDMKMQLQRWTREGVLGSSLIAPYQLELFSVLAGEVRVVASESRIPDWLRSFAMFFWYAGNNSFSQPLDAVIENYATVVLADQKRQQSMMMMLDEGADKSSLNSFPKLAAPVPTYVRELKRNEQQQHHKEDDQKYDILFHILRLYRDPAYPLDELLHPLASSPHLLDVSLSWLLQTVLEGAQLGIGPIRQTQITVDFALQLEIAGLWQWALYALLSLPSHTPLSEHYRNQAMKNVLCRHIEDMEAFGFALNHGGLLGLPIPEIWVLEARAWLYRSRGDWASEIRMHLKSGHYVEAHNLLLNKWAPSVLVDHGVESQNWPPRFIEALETLSKHTSFAAPASFSSASNSIIPNWIYGGNIYLSWHQWLSGFQVAKEGWAAVASVNNADLARLDNNAATLIGLVNEWTSALHGLVQVHKDKNPLAAANLWSKIPSLQGPVGLSMQLRQGVTLKDVQTELICASELASKLVTCHKELKMLIACEAADIAFPAPISSHAVLLPAVDTVSLLEPLGTMFIPPNELSSNLAYLTTQYLEWRVAAN